LVLGKCVNGLFHELLNSEVSKFHVRGWERTVYQNSARCSRSNKIIRDWMTIQYSPSFLFI
jgi:hypothetical protein